VSHDQGPIDLTRAATTSGPTVLGPAGFAPGSIIAGRYRLVALLGRGGMGDVYRADDLTLDQPVALTFLPQSNEDPLVPEVRRRAGVDSRAR
jgi:hypothetical protein